MRAQRLLAKVGSRVKRCFSPWQTSGDSGCCGLPEASQDGTEPGVSSVVLCLSSHSTVLGPQGTLRTTRGFQSECAACEAGTLPALDSSAGEETRAELRAGLASEQ